MDAGTDAGSSGAIDGGATGGDASSLDASTARDASSGLDAGGGDAGELDAGAGPDAGGEPDAGVDAGSSMPTECTSDAACAPALCVAGLCRVVSDSSYSGVGMRAIQRMVAGADADGTLRLLTDDGSTTYDVVGPPGALTATPGRVATDMAPLRSGGRQGTATSHASFTAPAYRWTVVDQVATIVEDRPTYYHQTVHAPDGSLYVLTLPRLPRGPSDFNDVYPLRLWSPGADGHEHEDLIRTVGTRRDFHLRVDAGGQVEVVETDAFRIFRWHLELAGWERSIEHTFSPVPSRQGRSLWVNDASGHTHLVHVLLTDSGDALTYVEMDDAGEVRSSALTFDDDHQLAGQLSFDDAGSLYFLSLGAVPSPDRRHYYLHRIAPDGRDERTLLGTLRLDRDESVALAAQPDGDLYVFIHAPARDLVVRELAIAR